VMILLLAISTSRNLNDEVPQSQLRNFSMIGGLKIL